MLKLFSYYYNVAGINELDTTDCVKGVITTAVYDSALYSYLLVADRMGPLGCGMVGYYCFYAFSVLEDIFFIDLAVNCAGGLSFWVFEVLMLVGWMVTPSFMLMLVWIFFYGIGYAVSKWIDIHAGSEMVGFFHWFGASLCWFGGSRCLRDLCMVLFLLMLISIFALEYCGGTWDCRTGNSGSSSIPSCNFIWLRLNHVYFAENYDIVSSVSFYRSFVAVHQDSDRWSVWFEWIFWWRCEILNEARISFYSQYFCFLVVFSYHFSKENNKLICYTSLEFKELQNLFLNNRTEKKGVAMVYPLVPGVSIVELASGLCSFLLWLFEELGMIERTKLPKILAFTWPLLGRGFPFFSNGCFWYSIP
ncbi:hypothetical protein M5K25_019052 [Dendrobium thyrsiflorum]|uniref:Uncharacterized protein n=1 Tax=Dendrobium thyrsiflorum TaxID=117978 RepID=A0ABD0UEN0_DENTH